MSTSPADHPQPCGRLTGCYGPLGTAALDAAALRARLAALPEGAVLGAGRWGLAVAPHGAMAWLRAPVRNAAASTVFERLTGLADGTLDADDPWPFVAPTGVDDFLAIRELLARVPDLSLPLLARRWPDDPDLCHLAAVWPRLEPLLGSQLDASGAAALRAAWTATGVSPSPSARRVA